MWNTKQTVRAYFFTVVIGCGALTGCAKSNEASRQESSASGVPAVATPAAPEPAGSGATTLSQYLDAAVSGTLYALERGAAGVEKTKTRAMDEAETKAYLRGIDLSQRADGPVPRCPNEALLELADAGGAMLGAFGFCQGSASFILPDGTTAGGVRVPPP